MLLGENLKKNTPNKLELPLKRTKKQKGIIHVKSHMSTEILISTSTFHFPLAAPKELHFQRSRHSVKSASF